MFKLLSFSVAATLLALIGFAEGHAAKVLKCPCTFSVSREVRPSTNNESFDIIVSPVTFVHKNPLRFDTDFFDRHSSRNLRVTDAIHTESGSHTFREMTIKEKGLFRVQIRHHSAKNVEENPAYDLELHTTARQIVCPIVLEPDQPLPLDSITRTVSTEQLSKTVRVTQEPRIVGGLPISPTLLSYIVALRRGSNDEFYCTGTLISAKWIITAAHCVPGRGDQVLVSSRSDTLEPFTTISRVFSNPLYDTIPGNERNFYDIAVAELTDDVTGCVQCRPAPQFMPINFNTRLPRREAFTRVAGFGVDAEPNNTVPTSGLGILRQVDVPAVSISTCRSIFGTISTENQQVCAGYLQNGGCDACQGDSGGPLVQYAGSTPILMGITSFGSGCAREGLPGVYTNPAGHREFLDSTPAEFTVNRRRIAQVRRRCPRGYFLPFVEGGTSSCTPCEDNQFSSGGPVRECEDCPNNLVRDTRRGNRCSCRALAGSGIRNGSCEECRPGSASSVGQPRCIRCPADTYSPDPGMAECLPCPGAPRGARTCASPPAAARAPETSPAA